MPQTNEFFTATPETAETVWFIGTLGVIQASADRTGGALSVVEFTHPAGFGTPQHVHHNEDEGFYVLEGAMKGFIADREWVATAGSFVWLPRNIPHGYAVHGDDTLRCLAITTPGGFDRFVTEAGVPAQSRTLPEPSEPDIEHLLAVHARHGLEVVGPTRM